LDKKTRNKIFKKFFGILFTGYEKDFGFDYKKITNLSIFLFLIIFTSLLTKKGTFRKKGGFLLSFFFGIYCSFYHFYFSFFKPIFLPRYLIGQTIIALIIYSLFINKIDKKIISFFILFVLLYFSFDYQKLQIKYRKKSDYKKLYKEIKSLLKKDDLVYVTSELDFFVASTISMKSG
jgi:hypothetical protein